MQKIRPLALFQMMVIMLMACEICRIDNQVRAQGFTHETYLSWRRSLGVCLALVVADRNPTIDLVLILCNPTTSFNKSQLQPILPLLEVMPAECHITVPYLLSFTMGDPIRMAMANVNDELSLFEVAPKLSKSLEALLP